MFNLNIGQSLWLQEQFLGTSLQYPDMIRFWIKRCSRFSYPVLCCFPKILSDCLLYLVLHSQIYMSWKNMLVNMHPVYVTLTIHGFIKYFKLRLKLWLKNNRLMQLFRSWKVGQSHYFSHLYSARKPRLLRSDWVTYNTTEGNRLIGGRY